MLTTGCADVVGPRYIRRVVHPVVLRTVLSDGGRRKGDVMTPLLSIPTPALVDPEASVSLPVW